MTKRGNPSQRPARPSRANRNTRETCTQLVHSMKDGNFDQFAGLLRSPSLILPFPFVLDTQSGQSILVHYALGHRDPRFLSLVLHASTQASVAYPGTEGCCLVHLLCRRGSPAGNMAVAAAFPNEFGFFGRRACCPEAGGLPPALLILAHPDISFMAIYILVECLHRGLDKLLAHCDPESQVNVLQAVVEGGNMETLRFVLASKNQRLIRGLENAPSPQSSVLAAALARKDLVAFRFLLDDPFLATEVRDLGVLMAGLIPLLSAQTDGRATAFLALLMGHPGRYGEAFLAQLRDHHPLLLQHPNFAMARSYLESPREFCQVMHLAFGMEERFTSPALFARFIARPDPGFLAKEVYPAATRHNLRGYHHMPIDPGRGYLTLAHLIYTHCGVRALLGIGEALDSNSLLHPVNIYHRCIVEDDPGILELLQATEEMGGPSWWCVPVPGIACPLARLCLTLNAQKILIQLLQHPPPGFDINFQDEAGNTLLHYFATEPFLGEPVHLATLVQAMPRVSMDLANFHGDSPLVHALRHRCDWLARFLLGDKRCSRDSPLVAEFLRRHRSPLGFPASWTRS